MSNHLLDLNKQPNLLPYQTIGYHGTHRKSADRISREGFDLTLVDDDGYWGPGIYFWEDSARRRGRDAALEFLERARRTIVPGDRAVIASEMIFTQLIDLDGDKDTRDAYLEAWSKLKTLFDKTDRKGSFSDKHVCAYFRRHWPNIQGIKGEMKIMSTWTLVLDSQPAICVTDVGCVKTRDRC